MKMSSKTALLRIHSQQFYIQCTPSTKARELTLPYHLTRNKDDGGEVDSNRFQENKVKAID